MRDPYEARDAGSTGWLDGTARRQRTFPPPVDEPGPDHTLPRRPLPDPGDTASSPDTVGMAHTMPQRLAPPYRHDGDAAPQHDPGYGRPRDDVDRSHTVSLRTEPDDRPTASPGRGTGGMGPARPDQDADEHRAAPSDPHMDVEPAVPAGQQIRDSLSRVLSTVRRSIPLRTVLFLLPPLALPALAFDLSVVATLLVALTLLWLAAAAAVFCMMMLEGNQQLALRSIEDRLDRLGSGGDSEDLEEALLAIGAQLDTLSDAVATFGQNAGSREAESRPAPAGRRSADEEPEILSHRPQEHWPASPGGDQYDRYGQTAVPDTNWSESRWRR